MDYSGRRGPSPSRRSHAVGANAQPFARDLQRQVPIAEMPGDPTRPGGVGRGYLQNLLRCRPDSEIATPFELGGDGLELEGGGYLRMRSAPEQVLEITAADPAGLLRIAWHLGNRHLPLQVAGEGLRIRADHVIAEMVSGPRRPDHPSWRRPSTRRSAPMPPATMLID